MAGPGCGLRRRGKGRGAAADSRLRVESGEGGERVTTRPRMIERWFPCEQVSASSDKGWGSGNSEANLFTWFAKRPLAQAKAAVITSLLPWPDDPSEQQRLQKLVREAFPNPDDPNGRDAGYDDLAQELSRHYPDGATMLDPFSGRA